MDGEAYYPINSLIKAALCQELKDLLDKWNSFERMPAATNRDYVRVKGRIQEICRELDNMAGE